MSTRIKLNTNFAFQGPGSDTLLLPSEVTTIAELLRHIGGQIDFPFIAKDGQNLRQDIEIIINDKDIGFYPAGLNTPLNDGDSVDITLIPLGGG